MTDVSLSNFQDFPDSSVFSWPLEDIRRFGLCRNSRNSEEIMIETGRNCALGEGYFIFRSYRARSIDRHMNAVTHALSTALRLTSETSGGLPIPASRDRNLSVSTVSQTDSLTSRSTSPSDSSRPLPPLPRIPGSSREQSPQCVRPPVPIPYVSRRSPTRSTAVPSAPSDRTVV